MEISKGNSNIIFFKIELDTKTSYMNDNKSVMQ